jgi:poly-gamma-glutamate synthesis protein (capsule biosynthesis protein)
VALLISACGLLSRQTTGMGMTPTVSPVVDALTPTPTAFLPKQPSIYIGSGIPQEMRQAVTNTSSLALTTDKAQADLLLRIVTNPVNEEPAVEFQRIYALLVPFFTVRDGISGDEIRMLWLGEISQDSFQFVVTTQEIARVLDQAWGNHGENVALLRNDEIDWYLHEHDGGLAILPFENISPRYKVMKIDGISPLDKPMNVNEYELTVTFGLFLKPGSNSDDVKIALSTVTQQIPPNNRDEQKMTVLLMSGTTAITRGTASKVELKGTSYPIEAVKPWFQAADLRHVSNEISFVEDCPEPDPYSASLRFCSQLQNIEVLEKLGVNIVELTGNHENDYGAENFATTLSMYAERDWQVFGGGINSEEARKPLLVEDHGNKIAFIGCNPVGPTNDWAGEDTPGAAKCDDEYMYEQIAALKKQGYIVVATFQHAEIYQYMYAERYREDFHNAVDAGADIVQGSQAHFPMGFELIGNQLIHYGLGNFLFDQMDYPVVGTRREFIDRHIFYDGHYQNTELLTALLTDWSRPVPMEEEDRSIFLEDIFNVSLER